MPVSNADAGPGHIDLRDDPNVTLGRSNFATLGRVDGTYTPDVLVTVLVIVTVAVILGAAANDACKSRLPAPGTS